MRLINLFIIGIKCQVYVLTRVYQVVEKEISFGIKLKEIMFEDACFFFFQCGIVFVSLDRKSNL